LQAVRVPLQEPPPPQPPKPLPAPDDKPRKKRAGKRIRKIKEKCCRTLER
jgi:U4/U6 small nuclear ribonucleoprotein PRP31